MNKGWMCGLGRITKRSMGVEHDWSELNGAVPGHECSHVGDHVSLDKRMRCRPRFVSSVGQSVNVQLNNCNFDFVKKHLVSVIYITLLR